MIRVTVNSRVPEAAVAARYGVNCTDEDYDVLLTGDCSVFRPDGQCMAVLRRGAIEPALAEAAYPELHWLRRHKSDNRGVYAGQAERTTNVLADGTKSRTTRSRAVASSVIGYFDSYPRIPFCRQTAFLVHEAKRWQHVLPLVQQVGSVFQAEPALRNRYEAQLAAIQRTTPEFCIPGSPFTTITVNNCVAAACHQDAGDFKAGFGVLGVLRRGRYRGGVLVFPQYRVAVDLQDRDLLFFNPHEWHSNTPLEGDGPQGEPEAGGWERISLVFYHREGMLKCGTLAEEQAKAKGREPVQMEDDQP